MADPEVELSLAECVCLGLVALGATHGWQVGTLLTADGEIGRIWSLSRPLTYRAIDQLASKGLIERTPNPGEKGRDRQLLTVSPSGAHALDAWLDAPIEHLRDVRTELLLKLVLRERAGLPIEPLLERQQRRFDDRIAALTTGAGPDDLVSLWRRESARAVRRFLDAALNPPARVPPVSRPLVRISARNQLSATVAAIKQGDVMATVRATLGDGQNITAVITNESVADLDLADGDEVLVIVKSTEVMIAKP